jgi:hypothetical protein
MDSTATCTLFITIMPSFDYDVRPTIGGYHDVEGYLSVISSQYGLNCKYDNLVEAFINDSKQAFTLDDVFGSDCQHISFTPFDYDEFDETETSLQQKRPRKPNEFGYKFDNVYNANWYRQFLHPNMRQKRYRCSSCNSGCSN